jgi:hypothetical protein
MKNQTLEASNVSIWRDTSLVSHIIVFRFICSEETGMTGNEKEIWFPAIKYGFGWSFPITWQGWAIFVAYLVMLLGGGYVAKTNATSFNAAFVLYSIAITVVFICICWLKGEKLGWRWGS